ncbi:MAG: nucleotidyl transferase AbiEii/AbiGii toxin family protein [Gammaproteobacteria bacterium]|nr:nucleotidyl transferase AbiEii/AbiGii toxin family protein [Gammaproteobacteria bacterium]
MNYPLQGDLSLPPGPAEAIRTAIPILDQWWKRNLLFLGGGTALAARWKHRYSTDVDLFIDRASYENVYQSKGDELDNALSSLANEGVLSAPTVNPGYLMFTTKHGAVSLFTTETVVASPRSREIDREHQTHVPLEASEEILAKKLVRRIWNNGVFVTRDAYDIVIAAAYDPEALNIAKQQLLASQGSAISDRLLELSRSNLDAGSELINAKFPNIGNRAFYFAHQALEGQYEGISREISSKFAKIRKSGSEHGEFE